jgi:[acyl-carrier-protein] S-malonyltransferase
MPAKSTFMFPGQGSESQQVGMLAELAAAFPLIKETFSESSDVLGYDMWQLVQTGPQQKLQQTQYTQPVLLTASVALWRLWQSQGGYQPDYMAGHSLGEYSALVCAGALPFAATVNLVRLRGEYMQAAVPAGQGAMAAIIGLADHLIEQICSALSYDEVVTPANYNCPGQVVIAGHATAVKRVMLACREAGARRAIPLSVSVSSHCSLMRPVAMQLADQLAGLKLQLPTIPVIQNVIARAPANTAELFESLVSQLHQPVQWTRSIQEMVNNGVTTMVECGPGNVLAGLIKRIDKSVLTMAISTPALLKTALKS